MPTSPTILTEDEKYDLIARRVFLDGEPAKIVGAKLVFPVVATLDGRREVPFAWQTVRAIVSRGGYFTS